MNWHDLPPLAALRAFASFAQTGNVTLAGDALNVSHAAISQQLRALEKFMGVSLLDRSSRALALTEDGAHLARALELGFGAIDVAVRDLMQADDSRPLHISTTPTFAAGWLMPRLASLRVTHPGLDVMLEATPKLVPLEPGGVDVAVRYGHGNWPGLKSEPLLLSPIVVVAAPELLAGRTITEPGDLSGLPWLEELGTTEGGNWLKSRGVSQGIVGGRTQVPGNLLLDGARDGQGVAVVVRHFVEPDLQSGRLCALFSENASQGYHILTRNGVPRAALRDFLRWLRRQRTTSTP